MITATAGGLLGFENLELFFEDLLYSIQFFVNEVMKSIFSSGKKHTMGWKGIICFQSLLRSYCKAVACDSIYGYALELDHKSNCTWQIIF